MIWLQISGLGIFILSIAVSHLPPFARKLFLVAIGFSFVSAILLRFVRKQLILKLTMPVWIASVLVIICGQLYSGYESHKAWKTVQIQNLNSSPLMEMIGQTSDEESLTTEEKEIHDSLVNLSKQDLSFPKYLQWRYSRLGTMKSPAPEITWGFEIFGSSLLGVFFVYLLFQDPKEEFETADNQQDDEEISE